MKTSITNEIVINKDDKINEKLIRYLMDISESANLFIMADSVDDTDFKTSHITLRNRFKDRIKQLSNNDSQELSNFTSMLRYCWGGVTHGLIITFGKTPSRHIYDSTYRNDVENFIKSMPPHYSQVTPHVTIPTIKVALMVHSLRSNLDGSEQLRPMVLDEFAMLDFYSDSWRYTAIEGKQQYKIDISSNNPSNNVLHLRIRKPHKQASLKLLQPCWVFDNKKTGFSFYDISSLKNLKPLSSNKAPYSQVQKLVNEGKGDIPEDVNTKNIANLSKSISNHEAYWNAILEDLLKCADINYTIREFNTDHEIYLEDKFKGRDFKTVTSDFMGIHSDNVLPDSTLTVNYYITDDIHALDSENTEDDDSEACDLVSLFHHSIDTVSSLHNTKEDCISLIFNQVYELSDADLIVGQYNPDISWMKVADRNSADEYGRYRLDLFEQGRVNTKQFMSLTKDHSKEELMRSISELLLKRWVNQPAFSKDVTVKHPIKPSNSTWTVFSRIRRRQNTKSKKENVFHCCFNIDTKDYGLRFSNLNVSSTIGADKCDVDFTTYYNNQVDNGLPILDPLLELIDDNNLSDSIDALLGRRYLKNDSIILIEHTDRDVLSVWEIQNTDLWIPTELRQYRPEESDFTGFIQKGIDDKAFTKKNDLGKIIQDKRTGKDPHYDVMIEDSDILIHRNRYNLNAAIDRHIIRKIKKVYPEKPIESIDECGMIISGLLPSEVGPYKDSGISKNIFEKIQRVVL